MPTTTPIRLARRTRRRRVAPTTIAAGTALGIIALTGFTATAAALEPQAGGTLLDAVPAAYVSTLPGLGAASENLSAIADDAETVLTDARATVTDANAAAVEIAASDLDLGVDTTIEIGNLRDGVVQLAKHDVIPLLLLPELTDDVAADAAAVKSRVAELRTVLDAAEAKKAAEDAAAQAAAAAKRKAEEAAAALAAGNTVEGAKANAQRIAAEQYGWGAGEFSCLVSLWTKESGWNYQAYNAGSGATGIPQSLPGDKMATAGADWQTNATTQIRWGLDYIARAYGSPCSAWGHSQATDWY
ncbi:hypothetical protein JOD63_000166 [Microbacterium terrae]|uniref:Phospholipase n=1 Tax=Microbacterium terrae TaxID=69369 RepID=A0A0M2GXT3_9MICO|nr:outer membrane phospholipase A [Microbacterium terrae]KJL38779.1 hypothetical protein RS81_02574 [Microbacterium terrae]MBP1076198.1 hypothetical protein [Microbacterium terrae]GLJ97019.1 hypothetical protein GCM10017594_02160 [Microbacterium terrae]